MNPKTGKSKDIGLDDIQKEVKRLKSRATTLQSKAIARTDVNVQKTGCAMTIIKNNTHNIEMILVEELRPVINETHHLVRETRLRMGSYAKGNWLTDFYARANGPYLGIANVKNIGNPRLERNVNPMGSLLIFGGAGEFMELILGNLQEKLMGPMASIGRQLNSTYPKQWEKLGDPRKKASILFNRELMRFMFSKGGEAKMANTPYRGTISWDPTTRRILIQLDRYLDCKSPVHCEVFTITDTFISPSRGTM